MSDPVSPRSRPRHRAHASTRAKIRDSASVRTTPTAESYTPQATLTEVAVETIRDRILDLTLAPSSRIDEKLLMDRFQLSRTPAREALNRLMAEGLVQMQPKKGAFVRPLDIAHVRQLFDVYFVSERMNGFFCRTSDPGLVDDLVEIQRDYDIAQEERRFLDMTRYNAHLHTRIARATSNEYVFDFSVRLHRQARRVSYFIYLCEADQVTRLTEHQQRIRHDHLKIIDTIRRDDRHTLMTVLTQHAQLFHERIIRAIGETRGISFPMPDILVG